MKEYPQILYPADVIVDRNLIEYGNYRAGYTESYFEYKLDKYFRGYIFKNVVIDDGRTFPYQPDYVFFDERHNLYIDIEIDEPYVYSTGKPIHIDDKKRNDYFLSKGWSIIRFAEIQVTKYPELCCKIIAEHVRNLSGENIWVEGFHELENLDVIKSWNLSEATTMAQSYYRQTYLMFLRDVDRKPPSISIIADGIFLDRQITETKLILSEIEEIREFKNSAKISMFLRLLIPYTKHFKSESTSEKIYVEFTIYISKYHSFYNFSFDTDFIEIGNYVINVYYVRTNEIICFEIVEKIMADNVTPIILIADDPAYPGLLETKNKKEIILVKKRHDSFMPPSYRYINIDNLIESSLEIVYEDNR